MPKGVYKRTKYHIETNRLGHLGQRAWNKGTTVYVEKICPICRKTFKAESWRNQKVCSKICAIEILKSFAPSTGKRENWTKYFQDRLLTLTE